MNQPRLPAITAVAAISTTVSTAATTTSAAVAATTPVASAPTAISTATASARPARAASTFRLRPRFVHYQVAPSKILTVERIDGAIGIFIVGHFHECESTGLPGETVTNEIYT